MAKRSINLKGTENKVYDLDKIAEEARNNETKALVVQVHTYDPAVPGQTPNPESPKVGQIWLSKRVSGS
jgi:hypothetical protein